MEEEGTIEQRIYNNYKSLLMARGEGGNGHVDGRKGGHSHQGRHGEYFKRRLVFQKGETFGLFEPTRDDSGSGKTHRRNKCSKH